jgi:hypothetical protein
MRTLELTVSLVIMCLVATSTRAAPDTAHSQHKRIHVTDLFSGQFKSVDIEVAVPQDFVVTALPKTFGRYMCAPSNLVTQVLRETSGEFPDPGDTGYFAGTLSMVYGYDRDKNIFTDFKKNTEKTLADGLQAAGAKQVSVRRADTAGYPVLLIDAVMPDGSHFCNVFIALKVETNVLSIRYFPSKGWSKRDAEQWKAFIDGFGDSGGNGKE